MFGGDRFGPDQDYASTYRALGGTGSSGEVNSAIQSAFDYLAIRYDDPAYHDSFPPVNEALAAVAGGWPLRERDRLARTFAHHELGRVPSEYAAALRRLARRHRLGLVADIWATRDLWVEELNRAGVLGLFDVLVFSSDNGSVKPSPEPFRRALREMGGTPDDAVMVGDSAHRDGGGAQAAGLSFVLVGADRHPSAVGQIENLLSVT